MVEILWEVELPPDYDKERVLGFCSEVAIFCGVSETAEFSIVFVDDERMAQINSAYRDKPETTDVLSFAFQDQVDWPVDGPQILGEIFISTQTLITNAEYFSVEQDLELKRLIIHGVLHLLGNDHKTNDPAEPMLEKQEQILTHFSHFSLKNFQDNLN